MRFLLLSLVLSLTCSGQNSAVDTGTWKINSAKSTFAGEVSLKSFIARIGRHPKGELFTLERIETTGRATTYSTVLYLDGEPRRFEDFGCSGIQSSRRIDDHRIEILRMCASGAWMRLQRRTSAKTNELVMDITEQSSDGHRFDRRLTLLKQ